MAIMEPRRPVPFGTIAILHGVDFVLDLRERLTRWNRRRITRATLARLSDHELADIGLARDDIETVTRRMG